MDILAQLPHLEDLCQRLYQTQNPQERLQVEQILGTFGQSTEYVSHLRAILDNSRSPYAQMLASSSLLKLVTDHSLSASVRTDMKQYFLTYLDTHCHVLEHFVATSLIQLLCRTTKLGWFDHDSHRVLVDEAQALMDRNSPPHFLLALRILHTLVQEMNTPTAGRTLTQHRKIAVHFRDAALLKTFTTALAALKQLHTSGADAKLKQEGLQLALQCLSFDFVGTCLDESSEELCTIQVPSTWRPIVEEPGTLQLFLDIYATTAPPLSNAALECLVRMASVRRSLFASEGERFKFLNQLVGGTRQILQSKAGLAAHENYHELCRLLGRLKTNYQLSELVSVEFYTEWIQAVAELTIHSLNSWQWASSSVYYLLGLWSRLVSSMPYLKGDCPSLLETNVPAITTAYITSRLESVALVAGNAGLDDMLDNEEQLAEQMDALPYLVRFQYDKSAAYVAGLFEPLAEAYKAASQTAIAPVQLAILEGKLTWLVHIVGAIIKGRLSSSSAESQEAVDGDLAARVFSLLRSTEEGLHAHRFGERSRQRLDIAIIGFFQCFRKVYIGEQVMHSSKVYTKLSERLGLEDHLGVLHVMLTDVAKCLRVYGDSEEVVHLALGLFQDLASGYMSGKLLMKLDSIGFLLQNHTEEHYAFLAKPVNSRNRTTFYATLARLLFMEDSGPGAKFKAFVAPLHATMNKIAAAASVPLSAAYPTPAAALRAAIPAHTIIGLFRDLRGIASATNSRRTYSLLFDWLYPQHLPTILLCCEAWADTPAVTTPLLKFIAEFAFNKSQRLTFDSSSPNGILLFREVSKVLVSYGRRILALGPAASSGYDTRYKGIWICLLALSRAMSGGYVNFGVFELYGDPALKDALDVSLALVLSMALSDILAYRKVGKSYYALLEVLAHNHTATLACQDTPTFTFLLSSLEAGLKSLDVATSSSCASAVDNLAAFFFRHCISGTADSASSSNGVPPKGAREIAEHVRQQPSLFPELLKTLFELVLFEECSNQWSLSRPMLSLILINESIYNDLKVSIIQSQASERQSHLSACLDKLMVDVGRNLEAKNKDKFTQALTIVRHEYRAK
ncbi:MAG: hypothetical protein WDW36_001972 [Sanguina aurantia]